MRAWLAMLWCRWMCRHQWEPIYHSWRCTKCGLMDFD